MYGHGISIFSDNFRFFLFSVFFYSPSFSTWAADEEKINILYLNSYHNGYEWSDSIFDGVRDTFAESGRNIYLQIEYMDSKRYSLTGSTNSLSVLSL